MRLFTCIDCSSNGSQGVEYNTDAIRGPLPSRCPEHQRLHLYHLQKAYLERKGLL